MLAIDDILAEAKCRLNDHSVFAAVHRVNGKEHPRLLRVDHLLDNDSHSDVIQGAFFGAIEDGAVGEERQPTLDDFVEYGSKAIDVEIALLLAGIARYLGVLRACRRTH